MAKNLITFIPKQFNDDRPCAHPVLQCSMAMLYIIASSTTQR